MNITNQVRVFVTLRRTRLLGAVQLAFVTLIFLSKSTHFRKNFSKIIKAFRKTARRSKKTTKCFSSPTSEFHFVKFFCYINERAPRRKPQSGRGGRKTQVFCYGENFLAKISPCQFNKHKTLLGCEATKECFEYKVLCPTFLKESWRVRAEPAKQRTGQSPQNSALGGALQMRITSFQ